MVFARDDPRRRALEDGEVLHPIDDARHDLDRAGAGADHADALAREIDRCVPARGVELRAGETLAAGNIGDVDAVELAGSDDQRGRAPCAAIGRSEEHTSELQSLMRKSYAV